MISKMTLAKGRLETLQIYKVLQCVQEQDKAQIEKLIRLGLPGLINCTEPLNGDGALHIVARTDDVDMCNFLLNLGASPNIQDLNGCTPAMKASELGHYRVLEVLVKAKANISTISAEGKGILFYCISPTKRHLRCFEIALKCGADVNTCTTIGKPVLLAACEQARDCKEMCLTLLEKGANPSAIHPITGRTALMEAAREGALDIVRRILEKGGDVNAFDKQRYSAVHFAAKGGFFEILKVLSAYNGDMGLIAMDGNTALHLAASGGFANCCKFLGQRGCDPTWKNLKTLTPTAVAKEGGFKAVVKELSKITRLFKKYSKPGKKNPNPPWAITLHDWSFEHQENLRKLFQVLDKGDGTIQKDDFASVLQKMKAPLSSEQLQSIINIHEKGRAGIINPEEFLKGSKFLQKAFLLSSYGRKKSRKGKKGKKGKSSLPLPICTLPNNLISRREDGGPPNFYIETFQNITDVTRFDCDHPPPNPLTDDTGWYMDEPEKVYTHINSAIKSGDLESIMRAFQEGVPVDVKDTFYKTPLMTACSCGNIDVVKLLLEKGADVHATDNFLWTPLHHACHAGQQDIAELLLKTGAKIDALAINGSTPLMRAVESGSLNCVQFLINSGAKVQLENKKGQNVLDIAKAYADYRLIDFIQAKLDSLPKPKKSKEKGKMEGKSKAASKPKSPVTIESALVKPKIQVPNEELHSTKDKKSSIVRLNNLIANGATNKVDITFVPKSVWGHEPTTRDLIIKKEKQRERFTYEVDFNNFKMPFCKNLMEKLSVTDPLCM
ncbi:ankyrin repeat and EF-hand domain-containing protein 1 [Rhinophrynus dorsalis]